MFCHDLHKNCLLFGKVKFETVTWVKKLDHVKGHIFYVIYIKNAHFLSK